MIEIACNKPIEVTQEQYNMIVSIFPMIVAHREDKGRFYIKLWVMEYKDLLMKILEQSCLNNNTEYDGQRTF